MELARPAAVAAFEAAVAFNEIRLREACSSAVVDWGPLVGDFLVASKAVLLTLTLFIKFVFDGSPLIKNGCEHTPLLGPLETVSNPQRFKLLWKDLYLEAVKYSGMIHFENFSLLCTLKDLPSDSQEMIFDTPFNSAFCRSKCSFMGNCMLIWFFGNVGVDMVVAFCFAGFVDYENEYKFYTRLA